ncbi:MAG: type II secretion system protein J [Phycisphaerae bacterium]
MNTLRHRRGLTLIELLVAVVLMAIVMGSLAVAMHASVDNYTTNESIAVATQAARSVLNRIADDIRTANGISVPDTTTVVIIPQSPTVSEVQYKWDGTKLTWTQTKSGIDSVETLLGGMGDEVSVTSFTVSGLSGKDANGKACIKNVTLVLKVKVGDETQLMRASASPRRNQTY